MHGQNHMKNCMLSHFQLSTGLSVKKESHSSTQCQDTILVSQETRNPSLPYGSLHWERDTSLLEGLGSVFSNIHRARYQRWSISFLGDSAPFSATHAPYTWPHHSNSKVERKISRTIQTSVHLRLIRMHCQHFRSHSVESEWKKCLAKCRKYGKKRSWIVRLLYQHLPVEAEVKHERSKAE